MRVIDADEIFLAIRALPVAERLRLVEQVVHDLAEMSARGSAEEAGSLLGLFAAEPDLVDDVCQLAMDARKRDPLRSGSGSDEGAP
jgi:hypothetical protein